MHLLWHMLGMQNKGCKEESWLLKSQPTTHLSHFLLAFLFPQSTFSSPPSPTHVQCVRGVFPLLESKKRGKLSITVMMGISKVPVHVFSVGQKTLKL